jgi:hypothetical protein
MATMATPTNTKQLHAITKDVVFVAVHFGVMGNSKKVRMDSDAGSSSPMAFDESGQAVMQFTNTIGVKTDAALDLLATNKRLLDSPQLKAIVKADAELRGWVYLKSLPYDNGIRLLHADLVPMIEEKLKGYQAERQALVEGFMSAYYDLCLTAKARLGTLYNPKDYPTGDVIRAKFYFDWQYMSFAVPESIGSIDSGLQAKLSEVADNVQLLMRESLLEMVSHLANRLSPDAQGNAKILHSTAVTHLQEFLSTFQFRNIANDSELAAVVDKVKALVSGVSAEGLKSNAQWKETVQAGMAKITNQLSGMVENVPGRKIRIAKP